MSDDIEMRRRRALWRAQHRGTKELDLMIGRYAVAYVPAMPEAELSHFEAFLSQSDPALQTWLLTGGCDGEHEFADVVRALRRFHGLN